MTCATHSSCCARSSRPDSQAHTSAAARCLTALNLCRRTCRRLSSLTRVCRKRGTEHWRRSWPKRCARTTWRPLQVVEHDQTPHRHVVTAPLPVSANSSAGASGLVVGVPCVGPDSSTASKPPPPPIYYSTPSQIPSPSNYPQLQAMQQPQVQYATGQPGMGLQGQQPIYHNNPPSQQQQQPVQQYTPWSPAPAHTPSPSPASSQTAAAPPSRWSLPTVFQGMYSSGQPSPSQPQPQPSSNQYPSASFQQDVCVRLRLFYKNFQDQIFCILVTSLSYAGGASGGDGFLGGLCGGGAGDQQRQQRACNPVSCRRLWWGRGFCVGLVPEAETAEATMYQNKGGFIAGEFLFLFCLK